MSKLTVWKFFTPTGADEALATLAELRRQHAIVLIDAATVAWPSGKKGPRTRQAVDLVGRGALDGAFWGMLFGFIFFAPFLGMAAGAAMGAMAGRFADYGIDDGFIDEVRENVTEGTSALFLLYGAVTEDKVKKAFEGVRMELMHSNLSDEQEERLRAAFGGGSDDSAE